MKKEEGRFDNSLKVEEADSKTLRISSIAYDDDNAKIFNIIKAHHGQLETLSITQGLSFTNKHEVEQFAQLIENRSTLQHFKMLDPKLAAIPNLLDPLIIALSTCSNLESIDVMADDTVCLISLESLRRLNVSSLSLWGCRLGQAHLEMLETKPLEFLSIRCNKLCWEHYYRSLPENYHLQFLYNDEASFECHHPELTVHKPHCKVTSLLTLAEMIVALNRMGRREALQGKLDICDFLENINDCLTPLYWMILQMNNVVR